MSIRILDFRDPMGTCQLCGKPNEELRPYGPNGESICFDCGMKDEETTKRKFAELIGDSEKIIFAVVVPEDHPPGIRRTNRE